MAGRPAARAIPDDLVGLVRQLGVLLGELGLGEIEVAVGDLRVRIQRPTSAAPAPAPSVPAVPAPVPSPVEAEVTTGMTIEAPMVGTFYRAPSPTSPPFVREGDVVKEGQTLAIIEAMKLMNEIESTTTGRVVRILAENGQAVEFGQPLFLIEPAR